MNIPRRQSEVLTIARSLGRVSVDDLSRRFKVSTQTIRKDLADLCERRSLTRVHGGAIVASGVENLAYAARRLEKSGVQDECGPKLNPKQTAEYRYEKSAKDGDIAPQRKLANEKPQGETINYDTLIKSWPATPPKH